MRGPRSPILSWLLRMPQPLLAPSLVLLCCVSQGNCRGQRDHKKGVNNSGDNSRGNIPFHPLVTSYDNIATADISHGVSVCCHLSLLLLQASTTCMKWNAFASNDAKYFFPFVQLCVSPSLPIPPLSFQQKCGIDLPDLLPHLGRRKIIQ